MQFVYWVFEVIFNFDTIRVYQTFTPRQSHPSIDTELGWYIDPTNDSGLQRILHLAKTHQLSKSI